MKNIDTYNIYIQDDMCDQISSCAGQVVESQES